MSEHLRSAGPDRSTDILGKVMLLLHELEHHARITADASYQQRMIERLRQQIPDEMRRLLDMHLRETERRLRRRYPPERASEIFQAIRSRTTRDVHAENLYDSILSTSEYPIHSKAYGISLLNRHLATMAIDRAPPEMLETYGWMSFDMNGVKGMVDCTTYQNVTHYLQAVAQFLLDREGQTRRWLEGQKIKVIPLAAGGDEFALFLDSEKPMSRELFREAAGRYRVELAACQDLSRFLNFDDRSVQLEFRLPSEAERAAFFKMSGPEQDAYLAGGRDNLPKKFISTCGVDGANIREGALRAVERGSLSLRQGRETFDTGRLKIIRHTMELAEARQADDKAAFKRSLEISNPKLLSFFRRNEENRRLDGRLRETEERLNQVLEAIANLERENLELRGQVGEQTAIILQLTAARDELSQRYQELLEHQAA